MEAREEISIPEALADVYKKILQRIALYAAAFLVIGALTWYFLL